MKKLLLSFATILCVVGVYAQAISVPRVPSPAAEVSQTIGISKVDVSYSRPAVKGREIWGALVPYGWNVQGFGTGNSAPWRAGANENTVITFSDDVKVEGKSVAAGSYGLFFVINADNTGEVILSKDNKAWGSFFYDAANDVLRSPIKIRDIPMTELLTYEFGDITKNTAELHLDWEKKQFPVKIEFATDDLVISHADDYLKGAAGFNFVGPYTAANYTLQNNVALDKGLQWASQAVNQYPSFTTMMLKANILRAMNNTDSADKVMKAGLAIADENGLNQYGYQLLNQKKFDEAISVFVLTTQRFPQSANAWDSLGEGYAIKGDNKKAIESFKKALKLNPTAATKANSEKYLKQLGAM